MRLCALVCVLSLFASTTIAGNKKFEIEVVSLDVFPGPKETIYYSYHAKIILPDGSHALAVCISDIRPCDLDTGYPERLKQKVNYSGITYTGFPTFQAARKGKDLIVYTATGKRGYTITSSW